jgi:cytochrome bd-type quinol oxidase subunit 1
MHVSSGEPSMVPRFAPKLYLIMVSLILLSIVVEGALIGSSLFAATNFGRAVHGELGGLLLLLTLLLPGVGVWSRLPGRMTLLSTVLFVLALLQVTSAALGRRSTVLAALHPANALLMVGLTVLLLLQSWRLLRKRRDEMKTRGGSPS